MEAIASIADPTVVVVVTCTAMEVCIIGTRPTESENVLILPREPAARGKIKTFSLSVGRRVSIIRRIRSNYFGVLIQKNSRGNLLF